jgi:tetratricopeptide (TPR) repeat protein
MHIEKSMKSNAAKIVSVYRKIFKAIQHSIKIELAGCLNMKLIASLSTIFRRYLKWSGLLILPTLIVGCASSPSQPTDVDPTITVDTHETLQASEVEPVTSETSNIDEEETAYLSFTPELMYYILTAEVAGQRGDLATAIEAYHRAADLIDSVKLAGRSAQLAMLSRDGDIISKALARWKEVDPNELNVYVLHVPFLVAKGQITEAVEAIDTALRLSPEDKLETMVHVSESLAEVTNPDTALSVVEQLDAYQQADPIVLLTYARMAFFFHRYETTLATLEPLLTRDEDNEDYIVLKSDALQRLGRGEEAIELIKPYAKSKKASDNLRFTYAKLLGEAGQFEEAKQLFEQIYADNPDNRDVLYALGLLALEEKDGNAAKNYFRTLLKVGDPTHQATYFMGVAEELNGNIEAAMIWYVSVPMQSGRFDMAQTRYIELLVEQGKMDKAREHLATLREQRPNRAMQYALYEASLLHEHGQSQAAYDYLTQLVESSPENEEVRYHRAMVAESLDKLDVLESDLRWILDKDPNNAQALNALGYTLTDRTDRHQEALVMIQKALEIKPGDPFYLDSLGWVYYRLGELDKAERYLREAIAAQPDVEFIAHLGEVLWEKGQHDEAKKVWQQGLQHAPENPLLKETMSRYGQ